MVIDMAGSAFKHGVTRDEIIFAMTVPLVRWEEFDEPRVEGARRPDLWIGPRWLGGPLVEVMAERQPPRGLWVFHAMPLRRKYRHLIEEWT